MGAEGWRERRTAPRGRGYYQLLPESVFVPYHSMSAMNVAHFAWNDPLPIYLLLSMFCLPKEVSNEGTKHRPAALSNNLLLNRHMIRRPDNGKAPLGDVRLATHQPGGVQEVNFQVPAHHGNGPTPHIQLSTPPSRGSRVETCSNQNKSVPRRKPQASEC